MVIPSVSDRDGREMEKYFSILFRMLEQAHGSDKELKVSRELAALAVLKVWPKVRYRHYDGPHPTEVVTYNAKRMTRSEMYEALRREFGYQHHTAKQMVDVRSAAPDSR